MKKCSKCKIEKPKDQFYSHPHGKNGLSSKCKTCCAEYENNPINKARRLEKQKQRRKNNLQHRATAILSGVRRSAKQKNLEMVLTKEWIEERLRKGFKGDKSDKEYSDLKIEEYSQLVTISLEDKTSEEISLSA